MTDVSVIVLDIDGGAMLGVCLEAIFAQSFYPREVIVFDNGSRIPVSERIAPARGLRVVRSEANRGFAGGNNDAYLQTSGGYVALVNNDVVLDHDWLASVVAALDSSPRLAAVQTILRRDEVMIDGAGIDIGDGTFRQVGSGMKIEGFMDNAVAGAQGRRAAVDAINPAPMQSGGLLTWGVSATAALYRREALGITIFDERLFAYYEDVDLCARLHEAGWRTEVLPVIKATHLGSQSAPTLGRDALRLRTRNRYIVARRHPGVGRISALLWEDAKLLARGRASLRGIVEGLLK